MGKTLDELKGFITQRRATFTEKEIQYGANRDTSQERTETTGSSTRTPSEECRRPGNRKGRDADTGCSCPLVCHTVPVPSNPPAPKGTQHGHERAVLHRPERTPQSPRRRPDPARDRRRRRTATRQMGDDHLRRGGSGQGAVALAVIRRSACSPSIPDSSQRKSRPLPTAANSQETGAPARPWRLLPLEGFGGGNRGSNLGGLSVRDYGGGDGEPSRR